MALSVGVTATISLAFGIRLSRRGWYALGLGALGLILLAISAQPGPARPLPDVWHWVLLAMVVPVGVIGWLATKLPGRGVAPTLAFGAGLAFTVVAVSARSLSGFDSVGDLLSHPGVWAIAVNGTAGAVVFAMALQNGSATTVTAVMFTTNTVLPSLIGLLVLGDTVRRRIRCGGPGRIRAGGGWGHRHRPLCGCRGRGTGTVRPPRDPRATGLTAGNPDPGVVTGRE